MNDSTLSILLIEDDADDAEITRIILKECGQKCIIDTTVRLSHGLAGLKEKAFDVVLLDLGLPDSTGLEGLFRIHDSYPQMPVVVMTGFSDEELSIQAITHGAQDYLIKGRFDCDSLHRSVRYAIERKRLEAEREKLIADLRNALSHVKQLSGLLPICASCKKIRDDTGYWTQVESYIREHTEIDFTHTVCPECTKKLYPEYYDAIWGAEEKKAGEKTEENA